MIKRRTMVAMPAAALLAGCDKLKGLTNEASRPQFKGIDITGADYATALNLPDVDGRMRTLAEFKGKVLAVFFGYVQCPDVCPATLAELASIKKQLGEQGANVQGIFVTVDPERDTPAILKAYMANFGPDFVALRGTEQQTKDAALSFKVYFSKSRGATPQSYTVDHTAGTYLFDPQGRVRLFVRYGGKTEDLVSDIRHLLR